MDMHRFELSIIMEIRNKMEEKGGYLKNDDKVILKYMNNNNKFKKRFAKIVLDDYKKIENYYYDSKYNFKSVEELEKFFNI